MLLMSAQFLELPLQHVTQLTYLFSFLFPTIFSVIISYIIFEHQSKKDLS